MQWYHKDKDPRMDERSARLHARMIKKHLVAQNYHDDVNVARASTYVTWDYGKKKECNATDLAIREHDHDYYDLHGENLLEVA